MSEKYSEEYIKKAREEYHRIADDEALMDAIISRDMWEFDMNTRIGEAWREGYEQGLQISRQEGFLETQLQIARKMKNAGIPEADIIRFTELSEEQLHNL